MVTRTKAYLAIDCADGIGEGPTWDVEGSRLLWSDNGTGLLHEAKTDGTGGWRETRRWYLWRTMGDAIKRSAGGIVLVAGADILTMDDLGNVSPFARLDVREDLVKGNEAKCDPSGRLWVGTNAIDFSPGLGGLYRVDPDGRVTTMLENIGISNGLDWSPGGDTLYYIDSMTRAVDAFDFDNTRGQIRSRRRVIRFAEDDGAPDGMTVDSEGCLWVTAFGLGEVRRYTPGGALLQCVEISSPAVTSCAFGGSDCRDLFITSAAVELPKLFAKYGVSDDVIANSHQAPGAGGVFACRPGVAGRWPTPFAG